MYVCLKKKEKKKKKRQLYICIDLDIDIELNEQKGNIEEEEEEEDKSDKSDNYKRNSKKFEFPVEEETKIPQEDLGITLQPPPTNKPLPINFNFKNTPFIVHFLFIFI